jgi:uncharacterized protein YjlB
MHDVLAFTLDDDGTFPNNTLPIVIYPDVINPDTGDPARAFEERFRQNGWEGTWRDGVYGYHHYHATAHEVLGCARGWVRVLLGGPNGRQVRLDAGDAVLLPAGTAHKNLEHSDDYLVIGAYPPGQGPDMKYGEPEEYEPAKASIAQVPMPEMDPLFGNEAGVRDIWKTAT